MIAYQQIQQSTYRRNVATLNGSIKSLQYAMVQYFYANCQTIYTKSSTTVTLDELTSYYPTGETSSGETTTKTNPVITNPFNLSKPQDFTLTITRASATTKTSTYITIETHLSDTTDYLFDQIATTVRPTDSIASSKTMTWQFSPFRPLVDTGTSQSSQAMLSAFNIWSSDQATSTQQSCDYLEYKQLH